MTWGGMFDSSTPPFLIHTDGTLHAGKTPSEAAWPIVSTPTRKLLLLQLRVELSIIINVLIYYQTPPEFLAHNACQSMSANTVAGTLIVKAHGLIIYKIEPSVFSQLLDLKLFISSSKYQLQISANLICYSGQ